MSRGELAAGEAALRPGALSAGRSRVPASTVGALQRQALGLSG